MTTAATNTETPHGDARPTPRGKAKSNPKPKGKRRGRGEGSVEQLADGRWKGWLSGGKDPATGKRVRKAVYARTKAECLEKVREHLFRGVKPGDRMTVSEWLDRWLAMRKGELEPTTHEQYASHARIHIGPHIGGVQLAALTPDAVVRFYGLMAASDAMKVKVATTLKAALKDACRQRLIAQNPADVVRKPRRRREAGDPFGVWDASEAAAFLAAARGDRLHGLYALALETGMRQGELYGLHWQEVDLRAGTVRVTQALAEHNGELKLKAPKCAASRRAVRLTPEGAASLRAHRDRMAAEGRDVDRGPVFCDTAGGLLRKSNVYRRSFKPLLAKSGVKPIRFHDLRHTAATWLLTGGVNVKAVAARLGHENAFQTLKTYAHVLPDSDEHILTVFARSLWYWQPDGNQAVAD